MGSWDLNSGLHVSATSILTHRTISSLLWFFNIPGLSPPMVMSSLCYQSDWILSHFYDRSTLRATYLKKEYLPWMWAWKSHWPGSWTENSEKQAEHGSSLLQTQWRRPPHAPALQRQCRRPLCAPAAKPASFIPKPLNREIKTALISFCCICPVYCHTNKTNAVIKRQLHYVLHFIK